MSERRRSWPLVVRRAVAADREAVLEFATHTWDGWDYIPHAWDEWLDAADGALLVALPGTGREGAAALDASGEELPSGRPVAVARVAILSPTEAWLEGIRVNPRVRGMEVGTDLQVAELQWAASQGVSVVRYATGSGNEGSHRLGARHGFEMLASFRTWRWSATGTDDRDDRETTGFDPTARRVATEARRALLQRLADAGLVVDGADAAGWWWRLSSDATLRAQDGLYEHRAWAMQELTTEAFGGHVERGEVIVAPAGAGSDDWAVAILPAEALPAEDVSLHLALLVGEASAALRLVAEVSRLADAPLRFRLPDVPAGPGSLQLAEFATHGFARREWTLDVLGRPLDADHRAPEHDASRLVIEDLPGTL